MQPLTLLNPTTAHVSGTQRTDGVASSPHAWKPSQPPRLETVPSATEPPLPLSCTPGMLPAVHTVPHSPSASRACVCVCVCVLCMHGLALLLPLPLPLPACHGHASPAHASALLWPYTVDLLLHATLLHRTRSGLRPLRYAHPFPHAAVLTFTFTPTALLPSSVGDALLLRCLPRYSGRPLALHTIISYTVDCMFPRIIGNIRSHQPLSS